MSDDNPPDPLATRPLTPSPASGGVPAGSGPGGGAAAPPASNPSSGARDSDPPRSGNRTSGPELPVVQSAPGEDLPETIASQLRAGLVLFGRYELLRTLGRGGFGVVWHAKDRELDIDVALKFLADHIAASPDSVDDLKRETRYSLRLTHPHIVRIYNFIQEGSLVGISMEYVSGGTLPQLRAARHQRSMPVRDLGPLIGQLCDALEYAHTKPRIVHRDLKPGNLMLDARGELKIADFGISRSINDSHTRLTSQGDTSGTLAYMSPQQMMGEPPKPADDLYALGATIYDLVTGKPPFHSGDIVRQALNIVPPRMEVRRRDLEVDGEPIPEDWEAVVAACLAKEAADRPPSALAVAERLGLRHPSGGSTSRTATAAAFEQPVSDATIVLPPSGGRSGHTGAGPADSAMSAGSMASAGSAGFPGSATSAGSSASLASTHPSAEVAATSTTRPATDVAPPRSKLPLLIGGLVVAAVVIGGGLVLLNGGGKRSEPPAAAVVATPPAPDPTTAPTTGPPGIPPTPDPGTGGAGAADDADLPARRTRLEGLLLSGKWDAAEAELREYQRLAPGDTRSEVWREELAIGRRRDREERELNALVGRFRRALDNRDADAAGRHLADLRAQRRDDPRLATLASELEEARRSWRSAPIEETPRGEAPPAPTPPRPEPTRPAPTTPDDSAADVERQVRTLLRDYEQALERLDVNAYAALWVRFASDSRKIMENSFRDTKEIRIEVSNIRVERDGDRATARFRENRVITPKAGREQQVDRDVRMTLARQTDGSWKITESGQ